MSSTPAETWQAILKGRTRADLAAEVGMPWQSVAAILSGVVCPRLDTAARLAQALDVSLDRFARAWAETRRRRMEREQGRADAAAARERFLQERS